VIYSRLVEAVALEVAVAGVAGRWYVARAGDAVFAYTVFARLSARARRPPAPSPPNRS
jgi:hypothetical protein